MIGDDKTRYQYKATEDGSLAIPGFAITALDCPTPEGVMEQEDAYLEALHGAAAYRLVGDRLEIDDAAGETTLVFVLRSAWSTLRANPSDLSGIARKLSSIDGGALVEGSKIMLAFHNAYRISSHAGCHDYVATHEASGDDLRLIESVMIGPDCEMANALQEQEGRSMAILGSRRNYGLDEG